MASSTVSKSRVALDELHQVLDLSLRLGVGPPAHPQLHLLLVDQLLEVLGADDVAGVFADHHQAVLVDHQLLGPAAKIIERLQKKTDDVASPEGPPLEDHVLVAAGRKQHGEDIQPQPAPAAVLSKIKLHLLAERQLRNLRVETGPLLQPQPVGPDEVADVVPQAQFVRRKGPVLFLQVIVDQSDRELPEAVGFVDLDDLLPVSIEELVPKKMLPAVGPEVLFLHGEVLGHGLGVKLQGPDDRRLAVALSSERLNLSEHRLVDHPVSCKVFPNLTGVIDKWEFHLPQAWDFCLSRPWEFCLP